MSMTEMSMMRMESECSGWGVLLERVMHALLRFVKSKFCILLERFICRLKRMLPVLTLEMSSYLKLHPRPGSGLEKYDELILAAFYGQFCRTVCKRRLSRLSDWLLLSVLAGRIHGLRKEKKRMHFGKLLVARQSTIQKMESASQSYFQGSNQ